jgi:tetratricopeptide (TPR) repeat protein
MARCIRSAQALRTEEELYYYYLKKNEYYFAARIKPELHQLSLCSMHYAILSLYIHILNIPIPDGQRILNCRSALLAINHLPNQKNYYLKRLTIIMPSLYLCILNIILIFTAFSPCSATFNSITEAATNDCDLYVDSKIASEGFTPDESQPDSHQGADYSCDKCADLLYRSNYKDAIKCYDYIINGNYSDSVNAKCNKAFALIRHRDYVSAIYLCEKVIENPSSSSTAVILARELKQLAYYNYLSSQGLNLSGPANEGFVVQKLMEVLKNYEDILDDDPYFSSAWNNKGLVLSKLGMYKESLECFEKAREINPHLAEAWNNKGASLDYLNRHDEAIDCYDNAIKIEPTAISWCNKGNAMSIGNGDFTGALECYNRSINIDSNYSKAWYDKGLAYSHLNRTQAAEECFMQAAKFDASRQDNNEKGNWVYIEAFGLPDSNLDKQSVEIPYAFIGERMEPLDDFPRLSEYNSSSFVKDDDIKKRINVTYAKKTADLIVMNCSGDRTINQVDAIYRYVVDRWSFVRDPPGIDLMKTSNEVIDQAKNTRYSGVGDCEDYSILMAALIEAIGGTTRINQACGLGFCHAYPEVYLGRANADDHKVEKILSWLKDKYNTDKIIFHRNPITDEVWLSLDADNLSANRDRSREHPGGSLREECVHQAGGVLDNNNEPLNLVPSIDLNSNDWNNPQKYITSNSTLAIQSANEGCGDMLILKYNLEKDGWAGMKKEIDPVIFLGSEGVKITYQGNGAENTLEIKLTTEDASYWKWLSTNAIGEMTREIGYTEFVQWMRMDGQDVRKYEPIDAKDIRFIEIAISNKNGNVTGEGQVNIRNLEAY